MDCLGTMFRTHEMKQVGVAILIAFAGAVIGQVAQGFYFQSWNE